jgi:hypothetical protein
MSRSAAKVAFEHSHLFDSDEGPETLSTIHVVSKRLFSQVSIDVEVEALEPHPAFVADVEKVFAPSDEDARLLRLKDVLRRWGSVLATHVGLGSSLVASNSIRLPYITPEVSSPLNLETTILRRTFYDRAGNVTTRTTQCPVKRQK